jgi:hypothetical protein
MAAGHAGAAPGPPRVSGAAAGAAPYTGVVDTRYIEDRVGLRPAMRRALEDLLAALPTLQEVAGRFPILAVIGQDEYTNDVIVRWNDVYLDFDTT